MIFTLYFKDVPPEYLAYKKSPYMEPSLLYLKSFELNRETWIRNEPIQIKVVEANTLYDALLHIRGALQFIKYDVSNDNGRTQSSTILKGDDRSLFLSLINHSPTSNEENAMSILQELRNMLGIEEGDTTLLQRLRVIRNTLGIEEGDTTFLQKLRDMCNGTNYVNSQ